MALAVAAVVAVAVAVAFAARMLSLNRRAGSFTCSWRALDAASRGWALGVARVGSGTVQWWRVFSLAPRPRRSWPRSTLEIVGRRPPDAGESAVLMADALVVRCSARTTAASDPAGTGQDFELAMSPDAYTGFASWLESAPPRDRGGVT